MWFHVVEVVAAYVHPVLGEDVLSQVEAPHPSHAPVGAVQLSHHVGHPRGGRLDKSKPYVLGLGRDVVGQQRVESVDHRQNHLKDAHASNGIGQVWVPAAEMEAYWYVELASFLVQGKEVGVARGTPATLPALLQYPTGPVLFREGHLLQRFIHAEKGQRRDPTQSPARLGPLAAHPAVVGLAQGKLHLGAAAHLSEEEGGVHHLDVDHRAGPCVGGGLGRRSTRAVCLYRAGALVVADASQAQLGHR